MNNLNPDKSSYQAIANLPMPGSRGDGIIQIGVRCSCDCLTGIDFIYPNERHHKVVIKPATTPLADHVVQQLQEYFTDPKFVFDLPVKLNGTDFQQRVWRALKHIPAGKPVQYGMLAKHLNSSARAVGGACRRNPVPIVVPCHRVVAKQGLGGFGGDIAGDKISVKQWLLSHEAQT